MASTGVDDRRSALAEQEVDKKLSESTTKSKDLIQHPGSIIINVQGAFIVDDTPQTPIGASDPSQDDYMHHTQDIRLPNHKAVVSHIAVDVRYAPCRSNGFADDMMYRLVARLQNSSTSPTNQSPSNSAVDYTFKNLKRTR